MKTLKNRLHKCQAPPNKKYFIFQFEILALNLSTIGAQCLTSFILAPTGKPR